VNKYKRYPVLEVNSSYLQNNAHIMTEYCAKQGVSVAGVIKFSDGNINIADFYHQGGCEQIASSRVVHLKRIKRKFPEVVTMLIRLPMLSEVSDVVKFCDISLNSERDTLIELNREAGKLGKKHSIILMLDVGDLREGVINSNELYKLAMFVEYKLSNLDLIGIGSSFACFGSILPTNENLGTMLSAAALIEEGIGRKLKIISGGSSVSLTIMQKEGIPTGINHLRIGGAIANPRNIRINRGVMIEGMEEDTIILKAELIEVNVKPSCPFGQSSLNWTGNKVNFEDKGLRKRAIAALGSQDIGNASNLFPREKGVKVIGCSSDHMILDIEDSDKEFKVGDIVSFNMSYAALMYAFCTRHVNIEFI
jgi:predicted amino acid racemase